MEGGVAVNYESIKHETDKAYLIVFEDDYEAWFPKSMVEVDTVSKIVEMPDWLEKKHFDE